MPDAGWIAGSAAQTSGLVAAYGFDEGSGTTVGDASGNGNVGLINGATWTTAGKYGQALSFNGNGARVTVNDSNSLDLSNGMTLEAWVYPTVVGGWRDVIYKGPDDIYFLMGSSGNNTPAIGGTFTANALGGTTSLSLNTWTHLAGTYDGAMLRLYVNGVQVGSQAQTGPIQPSAGALTIGGDALYGQYFAGRIDEVRIYNRALAASEIQADLTTPIGMAPPDPTPPTVSIVSPSAGSTVSHVASISAAASDNVGVVSVEVFVDGVSLGTAIGAPYTLYWNTTTASNGSHTLTAVARDATGNQTTSDPVVVTTLNPAFVNEVVVPGIVSATTIAFLPDGRMLVGELTETIWVVQTGANQPDPTPFLQLDSSQLFGEQGLMDIALDPNFAQNGYYYLFCTRGFAGQNNRDTVSRFTASGNGTVPGSEFVLWQDDVTANSEHHGGALAFAPDGKLFITTGEHFNPPDAQRLDSYRGKILRINSDGSIPLDNPFHDGNGPNKDAIWAFGLRNPFRMSIDGLTGRLFIGDVGGNDHDTAVEEVNLGIRGADYGWPLCEGACGVSGVTDPIFSYPHVGRDACITGGFVYRGSQFPVEYNGSYFFGEYVQNTIKRLTFDADGNVTAVVNFWPADGSTDGPTGDPVKLVEGPDGSLYYVDIGFNDAHVPNPAAIRRIRYVITNQPPVVVATATPTSGLPPLEVSFSSAGSFDPEGEIPSYNWTFGDGSSSSEANPIHTYAVAGPYIARLSAADGANTTLSSDLNITAGNPPSATILSPANGSAFRAGDLVTYTGSATDPEDGALPASAFTWTILFHHDTHVHPGGSLANATSGTLTIPASGHDFEGATSYEIILSVTDSSGLRTATSVTVFPEKVNLTFDTVPSGLTIEINGISRQTPFVLDDLIGFHDTINAPDQFGGGTSYRFVGWSDGGAQNHGIVVPTVNQSYVASFQASGPLGLVAAYGFNEGTGTGVTDASGNGNNGTIGTATRTTSGKYGSALTFNGSSARVTVPDANTLDLTTGMTLEAWVYPTAVGGWRDVIYKGPDDIYFLMGSSDNSRPAIGGKFAANALRGTTSLSLNTWTHLAGTCDGATLRLYVNGVQVGSQAQTGPIQTSTGALTIGGDALYGQYFAGRIDEVRIYNRALSVSEIQSDMNTPVGGSPPPNTTPTISDITDRAINEDAGTGAIAFAIGDGETAAGSLTLTGSSGNTPVVPNGNIVFGGSGANRTVTVTPAANQSGTATITVTVSDGSLTANDTFVLTVNAVNDGPTISNIADQSTTANTATAAIPVTVGDVDTAVGSLTMSGSSANTVLVPNGNIVFGGTGANRTVTVTPASGQTGTTTIAVTVSDGALSAFDTFVLTVNAANTAPTITDIVNQTINEDGNTGAIAFTVGDAETAAGSLTMSGSSGNTTLVPNGNIVFGGSGANRTVTVTPAANQNGSATITVSVSDGSLTASDSFVVTVNAVNDGPTISNIADQSTTMNTTVGPIGFTVGDMETAAGSLTMSGSSANTVLVPNGNIVFGGSGASRTVTVTPAANQSGTATITVTVSDGTLTANDTFVLTVNVPASGGLVAAYGFNEGSGTGVTDASGNGNNGTIGTATRTTSGKYGSALTFNGTSARVTVNDANSLDLTTRMTLEAWVYPTVVGGWRDVIYKGPNDIYYLMGSSDNGRPAVGGTFASPLRGTANLALNTWTHLAGTYDGTTIRLYVNGAQVSSRAQTGPIQTSTGALTIGGDALYGQYFAGRIDEVRIYNRALSGSEIQSDMNTAVSP